MYRYRLPYDKQNILKNKEVINGFLLFTNKWVYSKRKLDLPGAIEENASSVREFSSGANEERIRVSRSSVKAPVLKESKTDYTKLKNKELIDLLVIRGFSNKEYRGKKKSDLISLIKLSDEVEI